MLALLASASLALAAPAPPERVVDLVRPIVGTARKDRRNGAVESLPQEVVAPLVEGERAEADAHPVPDKTKQEIPGSP